MVVSPLDESMVHVIVSGARKIGASPELHVPRERNGMGRTMFGSEAQIFDPRTTLILLEKTNW